MSAIGLPPVVVQPVRPAPRRMRTSKNLIQSLCPMSVSQVRRELGSYAWSPIASPDGFPSACLFVIQKHEEIKDC